MKRLPKSIEERNRRKGYVEERGKGRRGTPLEVGSVFALSGIFSRNGWIAYDGYEVIQDRFVIVQLGHFGDI